MKSRVVIKVNSRLDASTAAQKLDPKNIGDQVNIVGMKFGELYRGDPLWYVDNNNIHYTSSAIALNLQNNRLSKLVDFPSLWQLAYKQQIKVGIYDSGVSTGNSMLNERVIQLNHSNTDIKNPHADYMATIIAGSDINNGYVGFLPNAIIYSYQSSIIQSKSIITLNDLKIALQRFLDEKVDVINISMRSNTENNAFQIDQKLANLINELNLQGIIVNCCTGQDNKKSDTSFFYPARLQEVFSVGGTFGLDDLTPSLYWRTNLWAGVDLLAPSDEVYVSRFYQENNITETEGTSVSTAITTGILGLLKIKHLTSKSSVTFKSYVDNVIKKMPDLPIDANLQRFIGTSSFKTLHFQTLKTTLQT